MKKATWIGLPLLVGMALGLAVRVPASSSGLAAQSIVNVPREWGEFVGADRYGLTFKDEAGTLRFVAQLPCGLDAQPHIALEIRRK